MVLNNFIKRYRVFLICFLVVFSFNFIPSNLNVIQKQNDSGMAARRNVLQYSFLYAKNPFILYTETAMASVGVAELTAGGLALLEGVLMPYVLGSIGVAGFLYGDTKFRQAEANIRRWAQVSADVATQLNETASKKKVGDTVTLEELPKNLVQKMAYELGNVNFDSTNQLQVNIANRLKGNVTYIQSQSAFPYVSDLFKKAKTKVSYSPTVAFARCYDGIVDFYFLKPNGYLPVAYTDGTLGLNGDYMRFITSTMDINYEGVRSIEANVYPNGFAPLTDFDLSQVIPYGSSTPIGNSVSYYPPSRTRSSDGQSISVPTAFPVSIPLDGTWERDGAISIPIPTVVPGTDTVSIPLEDTQVIPREDTGNPSIPGAIPTDWSVPNTATLNFAPLQVAFSEKFPFCLPFDFINGIKSLVSPATAPVWEVNFDKNVFLGGGSFKIDFNNFSKLATTLRYFLSLGWIYTLILLTKRIKGD